MQRELLLILKNGPIHSTSDHVAHQVETLSDRFDCELWAPGSIEVDETCGRDGRLRVVKVPEPTPIAAQLYYLAQMPCQLVRIASGERARV